VTRALAGEDPTGGALYFYNPNTTQAPEFWATRQVIKRIGNHNFAL
jgi:N-acetylmuramoyl-L-alanine amidase